MKKIAALILTLAMLCAGLAFATETEGEAAQAQTGAIEINWADLEAQAAETIAKGEFVNFDEIAVKMWMPSVLAEVELTDEDREQGYIAYYQAEDASAAIAVIYVDTDGMTLEAYKEHLVAAGATDIEDVVINGIEAVSYALTDSDTACVSFVTEAGYIFEVSGAPVSDEGFAAILQMVMASIQAE